MASKVLAMLATACAAVVLAGCGAEEAGSRPARATTAAAPVAPEAVLPAAFDGAHGWSIRGEYGSTVYAQPVGAPAAGLLLVRSGGPDGLRIVAHDPATGAVRWRSAPVPRPEGDVRPAVFVTAEGGREYAVLATTGAGADHGVDGEAHSTDLYVYGTDSSGVDVSPERHISLPLAVGGYWAQRDGRVVLDDSEGVTVARVADGSLTSYQDDAVALAPPLACPHAIGSCVDSTAVVAVTGAGPVVQGFQAFWVPGRWSSEQAVPSGASRNDGYRNVEVVGTPDGRTILAGWPTAEHRTWIWALHDGATGRIIGTVACGFPPGTTAAPSAVDPVVSGDGRYLLAGLTAFDLGGGKGWCFGETDTRRGVELTAVDDTGTAYGTTDDGNTPVSARLPTGAATPLPETTVIPDGIAAGAAYLGTSTEGGGSIAVYPPA